MRFSTRIVNNSFYLNHLIPLLSPQATLLDKLSAALHFSVQVGDNLSPMHKGTSPRRRAILGVAIHRLLPSYLLTRGISGKEASR